MRTVTVLRCANCGLAYRGATLEHLLLATSGAHCPSCRSALTEDRPTGAAGSAPVVRRRRIGLPTGRRSPGTERPQAQTT
jgi:DNA-directed RNA polymerase subunit RPC12/RpoP